MGFDASVNDWVSRYVAGHEDRLVSVGSVHPRQTKDPRGDAERLFDEQRIRMLKIHPPHQVFAANAYLPGVEELEALARIYAAAQERRRPVMIHTGTSIFPGARNRFADPMAADDVAVDFPHLPIILAHAGRPLYLDTAVFLVRRHPNVKLDLSGIPPRKLPSTFHGWRALRRCVWGTDYGPGIASMKKNREDSWRCCRRRRTRILWDNAARS
jgi:predicted TIM-barrel fold metal-dependent hydrolase